MELQYIGPRSDLQNQLNQNALQSSLLGNSCSDPTYQGQLYPSPILNQYHYHSCNCLGCRPVTPHDLELIVELVGKETRLNYGAKLRVLMADPIKGHDLRAALKAVQEALAAALA